MIQPKNETTNFLLSITKYFETLIKQTQRKEKRTLEFTLSQTRETFSFKPIISIERSWMIGLTKLEVYFSLFNITEEKKKLALYTFLVSKIGGVTYEKVKGEIERLGYFRDYSHRYTK